MFFRRTERKSHGTCVILAIGALAAIGAASIAKNGKQMISNACNKMKSLVSKDKCMCAGDDEYAD